MTILCAQYRSVTCLHCAGAIVQLHLEAGEQQKKEFMLAFTILASSNEPLLPQQVKERVEKIQFLSSSDPSGKLNFDTEAALNYLDQVGVLTEALRPNNAVSVKNLEAARAMFAL